MKNIIIIGDPDYARIRAHLPDHSVVLHDLSRGLPHDLYAAHIRLAETSQDFEVLFLRNPDRPQTHYEDAILAMARFFRKRIVLI